MKNVDNNLQEVEHDPLAGGKSINRYRPNRMLLSQSCFKFVCDRFQLRLGAAGADHKRSVNVEMSRKSSTTMFSAFLFEASSAQVVAKLSGVISIAPGKVSRGG